MNTSLLRSGILRPRWRNLTLCFASACLLFYATSCSYFYQLTIRAVLVDARTGQPIANAAVGARTIIDGQIIAYQPAVDENGLSYGVPTDDSGALVLMLHYSLPPARPDRVQLIVVREECEKRFMIEIDEDTADFLDVEESNSKILEFASPIVVPSCVPSP